MNFPSIPSSSATPPQQTPAAFKPNYDILAGMNSSSQSSTPPPRASPQPPSQPTPPPAADPFASLVSASPRPGASPFPAPAAAAPAASGSSALLDLVADQPPAKQPAAAAEDDEWNFASSLPPSSALPTSNKVQVLNSQLRVDFAVRRLPGEPRQIQIAAVFSNTTSQPISELHFQVAVEKVSGLFLYLLMESCLTASLAVYATASAAVRPRHCGYAAEWCAAGFAPGWYRCRERKLGEASVQGVLQGRSHGS